MNQQTVADVTLFDLLAREWRRTAPIRDLAFSAEGDLLAVLSADGSLALARLADNEPIESRLRQVDGQTVIQPRQGKPAPLISTRIEGGQSVRPGPGNGFLAVTEAGALLELGRSGEIRSKPLSDKSPVMAAAHDLATGRTVVAIPGRLRIKDEDRAAIAEIDIGPDAPRQLSLSPDAGTLALARDGGLELYDIAGRARIGPVIALDAQPMALSFSADGRWLACGLQTGGLCLVETASQRRTVLTGFAGPVASIGWGAEPAALWAAGAYRIAGWDLKNPPLDDPAAGAMTTGRGGFVAVSCIAGHPVKPLVAAGYANGQVLVARPGAPDEFVVRAGGGPVTALAWSRDGRHLAIGDALGLMAIVTFPDHLFK